MTVDTVYLLLRDLPSLVVVVRKAIPCDGERMVVARDGQPRGIIC